MNGCWFDDGTKYLFIVDASLLIVSFGDKAGFVLFYSTISVLLDLIHPFAFDNIGVRFGICECPSTFLINTLNSPVIAACHRGFWLSAARFKESDSGPNYCFSS